MTYCPECGSEVEPENTFCAYCGMALTPIMSVVEPQAAPVSEEPAQHEFNDSVSPFSSSPANEAQAPSFETEEAEKADELPPTLISYDNPAPDFDWSMPKIEPNLENVPKQKTVDSISRNTDSVAYPSKDFDEPVLNLPPEIPSTSNSTDAVENDFLSNDIPAPNFADNQFEIKDQSAPKVNFDERNYQEKTPSPFVEKPKSSEVSGFNQGGISNPFDDSEFQSTIPYSPHDFAKQNLRSDKIDNSEKVMKFNLLLMK